VVKRTLSRSVGLLGAAFLVGATFACSQFDNIPHQSTLPGTYSVEAQDSSGKSEQFPLTISSGTNTLRMEWTQDGRRFLGTGVFMGDVGVAFSDGEPSAYCGAMFYRVVGLYEMSGSGVVMDVDDVFEERATRTSGKGIVGDFNFFRQRRNGETISGTLSIRENGGKYDVTWLTNGQTLKGTGFEWGNVLAVIFGGENCRIALYKNRRGFFENDPSVVKFTANVANANGLLQTLKIDKVSSPTPETSNSH